jgi:hypothetical protein
VGCNLVVLKMTCSQSQAEKFKHTFQRRPYEQFEVLSALV